MPRIVGIDLGTTNSLIAWMDSGEPRVIPNASGETLVPSVIAFSEKGLVVGESAKKQLLTRADQTVYSVKRFMGRRLADLQEEIRYFPVHLSERVTDESGIILFEIDGKKYTPPELSAIILRELKHQAEAHLHETITQVVITVPAYFNDSQRQATKDAGRIAGLDVLRIISEPTAACLAYGLQKKKRGMIAVYDLGGGTFDISILKVKEGVFEVLATNGISHLGGDDLDRRFLGMILEELRDQHGVDLAQDPEALQQARLVVERSKVRLSSQEFDEIILAIPGKGEEFRRKVSRDELEGLLKDLVELTVSPCQKALQDAGVSPKEIEEVILVGGSTRMPLVQRTVREIFKSDPHCELNPDEVVALGAAIQAKILSGGIQDMLLLDVTPLSLGIETMGGIVNVLIPRNTTIPTTAKELFTTFVDGQRSVIIHVVQGERELIKDNRTLGQFQLKEIESMPAGLPRIEVTFLIDANGILNVGAIDQRSGQKKFIEIKASTGLTDEEVERLIQDAVLRAESDVEARKLIEVRMEATTLISHVERAIKRGGGLIDPMEKEKVGEAVTSLRTASEGEDSGQIRDRINRLDQMTHHLAEVLMDSSLQETLKGRNLSDLP